MSEETDAMLEGGDNPYEDFVPPEPTIGDLEAVIRHLRKAWGDKDRVDKVLETAERELKRIREERSDYYGSFGQ